MSLPPSPTRRDKHLYTLYMYNMYLVYYVGVPITIIISMDIQRYQHCIHRSHGTRQCCYKLLVNNVRSPTAVQFW